MNFSLLNVHLILTHLLGYKENFVRSGGPNQNSFIFSYYTTIVYVKFIVNRQLTLTIATLEISHAYVRPPRG